jgi:hypothetical protein
MKQVKASATVEFLLFGLPLFALLLSLNLKVFIKSTELKDSLNLARQLARVFVTSENDSIAYLRVAQAYEAGYKLANSMSAISSATSATSATSASSASSESSKSSASSQSSVTSSTSSILRASRVRYEVECQSNPCLTSNSWVRINVFGQDKKLLASSIAYVDQWRNQN